MKLFFFISITTMAFFAQTDSTPTNLTPLSRQLAEKAAVAFLNHPAISSTPARIKPIPTPPPPATLTEQLKAKTDGVFKAANELAQNAQSAHDAVNKYNRFRELTGQTPYSPKLGGLMNDAHEMYKNPPTGDELVPKLGTIRVLDAGYRTGMAICETGVAIRDTAKGITEAMPAKQEHFDFV